MASIKTKLWPEDVSTFAHISFVVFYLQFLLNNVEISHYSSVLCATN